MPADPDVILPHLPGAEADAPPVRIAWRRASALADAREVGPDRVRLSYRRAGSLVVEREPAEVCFDLPEPMSPAAIVHPLGTMPLAVLARWRGDMTLHGGAFLAPTGAWGICGDRTAGKSTLLAAIGERGIPVLSDDLVVVSGGDVLAGPQCVDLREESAARFPSAESLGRVGSRVRFRMPTAAAPLRAPLHGLLLVEWSDNGAVEIEPLSVQERLGLLYAQQYSGLFPGPDERAVMELLDRPMLRFRRPRDWGRADDALDRLLDATAR